MKRTRRNLALSLGLAAMLTLSAACGSTPPAASATPSASTEAAASTEASTAASTEATPEAAASITGDENLSPIGTFPICKEPITVTGIIQQPSWISDMIDNDQTRYLEKMSNIKLDLQVVPTEGYNDRLKIALTTGDYPDVIFSNAGDNNAVIVYGINEKIYVPLTPFVDRVMPNLAERFKEMPELKEGATAPDGNIYILPNFEGMPGHGAVWAKMWMNTAWLTKLGLAMPTTTDEFKTVLKAFKTQDPNGNGKADEVPLSGAVNTWAADPYFSILNAFDYFDLSLLRLKDGAITGCANTEGIRQGLAYLNELYAEGLLDPASLTQDLSQLGQLGAADPSILGAFTAGHVGMGIDVANLQLSTDYQHVLPLKGPNGVQGVPVYEKQTVNGGHFAITDKCKYPEAVMRMIDLVFSENFAMECSDRSDMIAADPGTKGVTGYPAKWKQNPNTDFSHGGKNNGWGGASVYGGIKEAKLYLQFGGDINAVENYEARLIKATLEYQKLPADGEQLMPIWATADVAAELSSVFTPINDYVKTSFVEFITGSKSTEKDWDAYLAGLDKLGYAKYIQDYNDTYFKK